MSEPASTTTGDDISAAHSMFPNLVDPINDVVYLGSKQVHTPSLVRALGFTHVIQISSASAPQPIPTSIHYIQLDDDEDADLLIHVPALLTFLLSLDIKPLTPSPLPSTSSPSLLSSSAVSSSLTTSSLRLLFHCDAGISRSPSLVVVYLMTFCNMSLTKALEHVRQRRPCIFPNAGFLKQLQSIHDLCAPHGSNGVSPLLFHIWSTGIAFPFPVVATILGFL
jgi:hypothetical protein